MADDRRKVTPERYEQMKSEMRSAYKYDQMTPQQQAQFDQALDKAMDAKVVVSNEEDAEGAEGAQGQGASQNASDDDDLMDNTPGIERGTNDHHESRDDDDELEL
ncbi:MAG: hypothetical protein K6C06_03100 [Lachnospiraceae bacterium]|nr:hypothetical protein [Lachnospiraceae bacterium]